MISPTIQQDIDLRTFNTFGIPVKTEFFASIQSLIEIQTLLQNPEWNQTPKFILGGGSNILFTKDFSGLIIKNEIMGIEILKEDDELTWLKIGAGENWHDLVMFCIDNGLSGIENLSLIPGKVGAAPIQNIGAYGVELKEVFHQLEAINLKTGGVHSFNKNQCEFGYRESIFKTRLKNQYMITNIILRLNKKPQFNLSYGALQNALNKATCLTLKSISEAVIQIRRSKLPDPKIIGNAGSFFKNPIISSDQFTFLQNNFVDNIPHFATDSTDFVKISAGWLIEQCGWKGKRFGEVGVYDKQALVLVNYGLGTGTAVLELAQQIQESVFKRFGIQLTPEVNII